MLKRILAMVLSVVMVLSLLPTGVVLAEGTEHIHCMCGKTTTKDATCADCGTKGVVWTGIEAMSAVTAPGNYYLKKNVTADPVEYTSGEYAFCLCGNEMHAGSQGKRIFSVKNAGTKLTITDCGTTGTITGVTGTTGTGSLLRVGSGAEFNLYGGAITGNTGVANKNGLILVAETGVFNMYGGEISNNEAGRGGAIYVQDAGSVARLLGGVITGNTGLNAAGAMAGGGGVYGMKGLVELGATIQIYGNLDQDTTRNSDMHIRNDQGCKVQLSATKPLAHGAKVNYGMEPAGNEANNYGITVSAAPADWSSSWVRYNGTKLAINGTKLTLDTTPDHIHCMCGKETTDGVTCTDCGTKAVEWIGTKTMPTTEGHYYLTETVKTDKVEVKANVSLCLHDKNLESKAGNTVVKTMPGYRLDITACGSNPGSITGSTTAYPVEVQVNSSVTLWNGKITGNTYTGNGIVFIAQGTATLPGGTFTMYGGEISDNDVGRGAVFTAIPANATNKTATVRLLGGKITGNQGLNTAANTGGGAGVYALTPVEIGGTVQIYGNTAMINANDIYLRNDGTFTGKLLVSTEKPLADGANVNYGLKTAETDTTNLKSITGTPANWSNQWVKLGADKVGYQNGKFLIDNSVPAEHIHCFCGAETTLDATCAKCGNKAVKWTGTDKLPAKDQPGYYFLTGDVSTGEVNYGTAGAFGICLDGHALKSEAGSQILELYQGVTMDITDCKTTGTITGATGKTTYGSTMRVNKGAVLTLWNGHVTQNTASDEGIIYVDGSDNTSVAGGTFIMHGGKISGNTSRRGAVYGVSTGNPGPVIKILGGEITGNTGTGTGARKGGAGVYSFFPVEVGGTAKIYGNTAKEGPADLYVRNDLNTTTNVPYTGRIIVSAEKPLASGANIQYALATAEADDTDLKYISGTPASWDKTWVTYAGDAVDFANGKFFTKAPAPVLSNHIHCMCGAEKTLDATCASCGTKAVRWDGTNTLPTADGFYYLTETVKTDKVTLSGKVSLCLHEYDLESKTGSAIVSLESGSELTITDCTGTANSITGVTSGTVVSVQKNAAFTLWNGKITGNTYTSNGTVWVAKGDATVKGGTFTMYGGEISNNTTNRGAVFADIPTDATHKTATIRLLGGVITGNTGTNDKTGMGGGAGVYALSPVEIGGTVKIYGNDAKVNADDVYLRNDSFYTGSLVVSTEKPLADGASIFYGLSVAESDTNDLKSISGTPAVWNENWVTLNDKAVSYENGKFFIRKVYTHIHCLCGAETTLDATCAKCGNKAVGWDGIDKLPAADQSGYFYLTGDVATTAVNYTGNKTVSICLDGHQLKTSTGYKILDVAGGTTVNLTDCKTTGTITGSTKGTYGNCMRVNKGSTLVLWNGTITGNTASDDGNIYVDGSDDANVPGGTFIMYGGKITGNTARRGQVYGVSTGKNGPVIKILGGEITGNTGTGTGSTKGGAGVYSFYPVEVGGTAKIYGNTAKEGPADLYVRNDGTFTGKIVVSDEKPLVSGANVNYGVFTAEADPMNLKYITGTPAAWNMEWVKYEGVKVGYEDGRFYTKYAMDYADHKHDDVKWLRVTQDNDQLPNGDGYYVLDGDVKLDKLIVIGKDVHVRLCLNGHTLTAADKSAHFDVQAGGKLTVCDCTAKTVNCVYTAGKITGGNGKSGGSLRLRAGAEMKLIDGIFTGNKNAEGGNGGVIYADAGAKLVMTGGMMCGNSGAMGGAIRLGAPNVDGPFPVLILEGGSICHNESTNLGGGIYAAGGADIQLKGGVIANNKAAQGGGGIAVNSQGLKGTTLVTVPTTITLTGTTIENNEATTWGGNVYVKNATVLNMSGGVISGGSSKVGAGILMENKDTTLNLTGGKITGNKAGTAGSGGVYASNNTVVNMTGGEISNNTAEGGCGGMTIYGAKGTLTGGTISGNTTKGSGGGLSLMGSEVYLGKVIITGNTTSGSGGGLYVARAGSICSDVTIDGTQITNNTCKSSGGGLFLYMNGNKVTMKDGLFQGNQAADGGGVVAQREVTFTMEGGQIKNNKSVNSGGGYYASIDSIFIMNGGKISGNYAGRNGGGVYCLRSKVTLKGGTVESNTAKTTAGGVYMSGANATLCGTRITSNKALEGSGGGVFVQATTGKVDGVTKTFPAKVIMTGGSITYNTTPKAAGGLLLQKENTVFELRGGSISNNTATKFAGGVYVGKDSTFNMYGGSIANNATEIDVAGGIRVDNGIANLVGGEIRGNKTTRSAGGLLCAGADAKIHLGAVKIYENEAKVGAGIVAQGKSQLIAEGTEIYRNVATQDGGGVYVYSYTNPILKNCKIYENTAGNNGGGLWTWATSDTTTENCEFTNNTAAQQGGAAWTRADALIFNGGVFTGNKAENDKGGAIFAGLMGAVTAREVPCVHLNNAVFRDNEAKGQGGAVYMSVGAEVHMDTVEFTNNRSNAEGGALWVKDETTLRNVTVTGNISGGEGFAAYLADGEYDGESFFYGLMTISGDMKVYDNQGGDMYLGNQTPMVIAQEGLGKDTKIQLTLHSGYVTQWVWGNYNYEGGDRNYTITYGDRSVTDPEEIPATDASVDSGSDSGAGNTVLYIAVGAFAVAVIAVVVLLLLKKKKAAPAAKE